MYFIFILGPAGSGKSYLTKAFSDWLRDHKLDVVTVNLDPAADWLPYSPDVDIRNYVTVDEVMKKFNLGPNGALIASVDLATNYISDIRSEIESLAPNYVIVDAPGQLEIFAFRVAGKIIIERLAKGYKEVSVFLIDSYLATRPAPLLSMLFLALSTALYLGVPQVNALSKADMLSEADLEKLRHWLEAPSDFAYDLSRELKGFLGSLDYISFLEGIITPLISELVPVSSIAERGLDALYAAIQRVLAGGEDYLTEEPSEAL